MLVPALTTLTPLLDGLLAGMFIGSSMVEHAARTLDAPSWTSYKHAKEAVFGPVMPIVFNLCLLVTVGAAVVLPSHVILGAAAALMVAALLITISVHLPLNRLFQTWSPANHPVTWSEGRQRWRQWNIVRAAFVIAAYGLILAAPLLP